MKSAGANPGGKLTSITAAMAAGADSIDDLDVIRSGGMKQLFGGVYAAATLRQFLREFTHGHTLQLMSVLRAHLVNLVGHSGLLPGIEQRALIDVDSLLCPVFGHAIGKAERAVAGKVPVKRNRFITLTGGDKSVNRELETKARTLAGWKSYITNIANPTPDFVIGAYHQLWHIEELPHVQTRPASPTDLPPQTRIDRGPPPPSRPIAAHPNGHRRTVRLGRASISTSIRVTR